MKHIKKKFQTEFSLTEDEMNSIQKDAMHIEYGHLARININKGMYAILLTSKNTGIRGFPYKPKGGPQYVIPEPDPILIYFNAAYFNFIKISEAKEKVLISLNEKTLSEGVINDLYNLFSLTSTFVILLFTSIEAFFNRAIPADYKYIEKQVRRTETYDREQIHRYLSFELKAKVIIPVVFGKDFLKHYPLRWTPIMNLKKIRDEIVHTKDNTKQGELFEHLYKPALDFKYGETLEAVRDLFNFYQPGYIEDCPCNDPI